MAIANLPARLEEMNAILSQVTTIGEAQKLLVMADSITFATSKIYWSVNKVSECKEDKDHALSIAVKAGEIKLNVEARLGALIKAEQLAGRLATQRSGMNRHSRCNNGVTPSTLKDVGLTRMDSQRAQMVAAHTDLIQQVVEEAQAKGDVPTRRDLEKKIKHNKQEEVNEQQPQNTPLLLEGKSDVVYADPPWKYNNDYLTASPNNHYKTLSLDEIKALNLQQMFANDAILFLWTTNPFLEEALQLMTHWGFHYKTNMVWIKNKIGLGFYFRGQHELLLVGIKGEFHPPEETKRFSSRITEEQEPLNASMGKHSEKPGTVAKVIEQMYPFPFKWLELFGRKQRIGWKVWGNQSES